MENGVSITSRGNLNPSPVSKLNIEKSWYTIYVFLIMDGMLILIISPTNSKLIIKHVYFYSFKVSGINIGFQITFVYIYPIYFVVLYLIHVFYIHICCVFIGIY